MAKASGSVSVSNQNEAGSAVKVTGSAPWVADWAEGASIEKHDSSSMVASGV